MNFRTWTVAPLLLLLLSPHIVSGQDAGRPELDRFSLQVGAGPLLNGGGNTVSAAFGFSPISRIDFLVNVERNQIPFQRDALPDGVVSLTRGGTLTAVSGEVRASLFPPHRISPYGFAGFGGGISRPTVNDEFPNPVENNLRVVYFGGGLRVPIRGGLSVFGDVRGMLSVEGGNDVMGVVPLRAGIVWRF